MKILINQCLFLLLLLSNNYSQNNDVIGNLKTEIEKISLQFAPDKRVAIVDFELLISENNNFIIKGETNLYEAYSSIKKYLTNLNISINDSITLLPSKELDDNIYGIINLSVANLRSKPQHSAELVTQALLGTPVKVLKRNSGFYLIQTPDNYISWVDAAALHVMNTEEYNQWIKKEKIIYINEYGHSYIDNTSNKRVSDLVAGNIIELISAHNKYLHIKYPDGRTAFINSDDAIHLSKWYDNINPKAETIISYAELFIGIPYLWGGTSIKGMDCSGFVKTVFFLNGLILPRDASQQVNAGNPINIENGFDELQKGDLLFFGTQKPDDIKEKITHVAIYIGDSYFIHASGKVKINSFDPSNENYSENYSKIFVKARRILNSIGKNEVSKVNHNKYYKGE